MSLVSQSLPVLSRQPGSEEYVLDPRKSLSDYRCEIYELLQYLDEQQDNIEKQLARFTSASSVSLRNSCANTIRNENHAAFESHSESESEEDDDFVVVEDINAPHRKKQLLNQLQQLWRTRDALRKRAKQLNIRIDSLAHGKGSGLMPIDDLLLNGIEINCQQDDHET